MTTVAHFTGTWLPLTEGWIHDQIRFTRTYASLVLASRRAHEEMFPAERICAIDALPTLERYLNQLARPLLGVSPAFIRCGRSAGVRLIHAHFGNRGAAAVPLAERLRVPLVTSFYGRDLADGRKLRRLFGRGDAFLAEGPFAAARLGDLGAPADRIMVHRLGIDLQKWKYRERTGDPVRLLMMGRFVEKKGFLYGLHAFARASRARSMRLTIVGDAGPSPREQHVKRELRSASDHQVQFLGFVAPAEVEPLLARHDVLVQPSVTASDGDSEGGHPYVLTQAAATGMPIIATRHCDIPEIVRDGETGWLCHERNIAELETAMISAAANADLRAAYGRNARRLVEEKYDIGKQTLDRVYDAVLASST